VNLIPLVTHPWPAAIAGDVSTHARGSREIRGRAEDTLSREPEFKMQIDNRLLQLCGVIHLFSLSHWPTGPTYNARNAHATLSFPAFAFPLSAFTL
jgi:hypothetical protein